MLAPTPPQDLVDANGRPYFLWDVDMSLAEYERLCRSEDQEERAYWMARALRDAKPDDALSFFTVAEIADIWPDAKRFVGRQRPFWTWYLGRMGHEVQP